MLYSILFSKEKSIGSIPTLYNANWYYPISYLDISLLTYPSESISGFVRFVYDFMNHFVATV